MRLNYVLIPLIVILTSAVGSAFTADGLKQWYKHLEKPKFTPAGDLIGQIWTGIFILSTISALLFYNSAAILHDDPIFLFTVGVFLLNAMLNIFWSYLFFRLHMIGLAAIEAGALSLSVLTLIFLTLSVNTWAGILLIPYLVWVCFATYLTYVIWKLN